MNAEAGRDVLKRRCCPQKGQFIVEQYLHSRDFVWFDHKRTYLIFTSEAQKVYIIGTDYL
jgi:hypothetical protein